MKVKVQTTTTIILSDKELVLLRDILDNVCVYSSDSHAELINELFEKT